MGQWQVWPQPYLVPDYAKSAVRWTPRFPKTAVRVPQIAFCARRDPECIYGFRFPKPQPAKPSLFPHDASPGAHEKSGSAVDQRPTLVLMTTKDTTGTAIEEPRLAGEREPALPERRSVDRAALILFDKVQRYSIVEQEFVFRALSQRLGVQLEEDQLEAEEAVRQCMSDQGLAQAPTEVAYKEWHTRQPAHMDWPGVEAVQKPFGGWTALRAKLDGKPIADLRALSMSRAGSPLTREELLLALRSWHVQAPDEKRRFKAFRGWAVERLRDGSLSGQSSRTAISIPTYCEHFGSWLGALAAAGILDGITFENFCRLTSTDRAISDEQLKQVVRDADAWSRATYGHPLNRKRLKQHRLVILKQRWVERDWRPYPAVLMIHRRLGGTVADVMLAAGLLDVAGVAEARARRGMKVSDAMFAAHIKVFVQHHGCEEDPSQLRKCDYRNWRNQIVNVLKLSVPSEVTMQDRLGVDWPPKSVISPGLTGPGS